MSEASSVTGKCLCGSIELSGVPKVGNIGACHCSMCRKWTAGPFLAMACDGVEISGSDSLSVYKSSQWGERGFCSKCGTSLFWRLHDGSNYVVSAELFEGQENFNLDHQIFVDEQPSYYAFSNKTKDMTGAEVFAMFAEDSEGGPQ